MEDIFDFIESEFMFVNDGGLEFFMAGDITSDDLEKLIELCQEELAQRASDAQD